MHVPGQPAARQQWVEEETGFVPFPRGLQEAQDLPGHWTPGTQQLPKQPGSLRKLQWLWFTLRDRQAQSLPLGLSWRLMTLIWSEYFIRWPKCPHRHCHLVMNQEIKGRPPRRRDSRVGLFSAPAANSSWRLWTVSPVLLANKDMPWFPLPPAKVPAALWNVTPIYFSSSAVIPPWGCRGAHTRHSCLHTLDHTLFSSPQTEERPRPLILWFLVTQQVHFGPYFLEENVPGSLIPRRTRFSQWEQTVSATPSLLHRNPVNNTKRYISHLVSPTSMQDSSLKCLCSSQRLECTRDSTAVENISLMRRNLAGVLF